jgi:hypothetical protein
VVTIALLPAPGLAHHLARELAPRLSDDDVQVGVVLPDAAPAGDVEEALAAADDVRRREGCVAVICLTDVPLRHDARPLAMAVRPGAHVAVIAIPALGASRLRARTEAAVLRAVAALKGGEGDGLAVRYVTPAALAHLRLLPGMVRANRPWRALSGLSGAVVAAFATGAYVLLSPTIWQLSDALGWPRLLAVMLVALAAVVTWLVLAHDLWEREAPGERRGEARLYNTVTVLTLGVAVLVAYLFLFLSILAVALVLVDGGVYRSEVSHDAGTAQYLALAWLGASIAAVAGGLGSGLEDIDEVRDAAYGRHQGERARRGVEKP